MTPTCYSCKYSFGAIPDKRSTLLCCPSGNPDREQLAIKLCDEYLREPGADEPEEIGN